MLWLRSSSKDCESFVRIIRWWPQGKLPSHNQVVCQFGGALPCRPLKSTGLLGGLVPSLGHTAPPQIAPPYLSFPAGRAPNFGARPDFRTW
jgi:hypothetical protein